MTIKRPKQNLKRLFIPVIILLLITCGMIQYAVVYNEQEVAGVSNPSEVMLDITRDYEDILSEDNDIIEEKPDNLFLQRLTRYDDPVKAPYIEFKNILDKNMSLNDFKGQWIVLNFWASWCPPCIVEMPSLQKLQDMYTETNDLKVVAIALDRNYTAQKLRDFMGKSGFGPVAAYYGHWPDVKQKFDIPGLPTTYILNPEGYVVAQFRGDTNWTGADARILIEGLMRSSKFVQ